MNDMPQAGAKYRHYKGNEYVVVSLAKSEADMTDVVVYQDLHDSEKVWVRPLSVFTEMVEVDGVQKPRFEYIGG